MHPAGLVERTLETEANGASALPALTPELLCERYAERVYRFAAMMSWGDVEAEDLAQDALERAIRRLDSFNPGRGTAESWLWQIVVSAAQDAGRLAGRRRRLLERLVTLRPVELSETTIPDAVTNGALLAAVRGLSPRDRALIALRYGAELDYAAVGAALGMSADAAGVAGRRALARLRKSLMSGYEGLEP